jgi:tetratricopeptide (TPR) repeat protein
MDIGSLIACILNDPAGYREYCRLLIEWPEDDVRTAVEQHKLIADQHWHKDPNISLQQANIIIGIGCIRQTPAITALGMMARGDALKMLGRMPEAWDTLDLAGQLYRTAGDEIGWARTRIGRVLISPDMGCVSQAISDTHIARAIFRRHGDLERGLRLDLNTANLYVNIGKYARALELYESALRTAEALADKGQMYLGLLYSNVGCVYTETGSFRQAVDYHERALAFFRARGETTAALTATANIANIAVTQGRYRYAMQLLRFVEENAGDQFPLEAVRVQRYLIECYLHLNRFQEARELAQRALEQARQMGLKEETGYILRHRALAEAELAKFDAALSTLDEAQAIFAFAQAATWTADVRLKRGQVALKLGDTQTAAHEARDVGQYFAANQEQDSYGAAILLSGQAAFASGAHDAALDAGREAVKIARTCRMPSLRYSSHLLLGRVAEAQGSPRQAIRRYRSAARVVEQASAI